VWDFSHYLPPACRQAGSLLCKGKAKLTLCRYKQNRSFRACSEKKAKQALQIQIKE